MTYFLCIFLLFELMSVVFCGTEYENLLVFSQFSNGSITKSTTFGNHKNSSLVFLFNFHHYWFLYKEKSNTSDLKYPICLKSRMCGQTLTYMSYFPIQIRKMHSIKNVDIDFLDFIFTFWSRIPHKTNTSKWQTLSISEMHNTLPTLS